MMQESEAGTAFVWFVVCILLLLMGLATELMEVYSAWASQDIDTYLSGQSGREQPNSSGGSRHLCPTGRADVGHNCAGVNAVCASGC